MKRNVIIVSSITVFLALVMVLGQTSFGQENNRRNGIRAIFPKKQERAELLRERFSERGESETGFAKKFLFVLKQLDLSDEQIEQIKTLRGSAEDEIKAVMKARKDLRSAVTSPVIQENIIRENAQVLGAAIEAAAVQLASVRQSFRAILNDEQLEKIDSIRERIKERKQEKAQNRQEIIDLLLSDNNDE